MEKIFLIGVVCVILISIAVVDARKKKIPNILLGILFFCAVLSGFIFPEISWPDRIAGGILVSVVFLTVIWIRPGAFGAGDTPREQCDGEKSCHRMQVGERHTLR